MSSRRSDPAKMFFMLDPPAPTDPNGVVTKPSPESVEGVVSRLVALIRENGMTVFAVVDHSGGARLVGLEMPDTKLVIFGSPAGGTPVMRAVPLAALDLPLKVLVWDDEGQTRVSYTDPDALASRHHLSPELAAPLAGIARLTDAVIAP
jgi:uncharacterized protein (DUF302 family)